ncbi:hypothetical protein MHYP_G00238450 [Metynnis hypsauchen]
MDQNEDDITAHRPQTLKSSEKSVKLFDQNLLVRVEEEAARWRHLSVWRMIMACCVLHSTAMKCGVPLPPEPPQQQEDVCPDPLLGPENIFAAQVQ